MSLETLAFSMTGHTPVMLEQTLSHLKVNSNGRYIDGTLGGGGHALAIASRLAKNGHLLGFDLDAKAIARVKERFSAENIQADTLFLKGTLHEALLPAEWVGNVDGILFDLGISSFQIDSDERGFSFRDTTALDMRFDTDQGETASDVLNNWDQHDIRIMFKQLADEPFAGRLAKSICKRREQTPFATTQDFTDAIGSCGLLRVPTKRHKTLSRLFQALRMTVNRELEHLEKNLQRSFDLLKPGGRLVVLTFHSAEDRVVKKQFKTWSTTEYYPKEIPINEPKREAVATLLTRKPLLPSEEELEVNPRARSAKLRAIAKETQ